MRMSLTRFRPFVKRLLAFAIALAGCVDLAPPWQGRGSADRGGALSGQGGTGGAAEEIQPDADDAPAIDAESDVVTEGEGGAADVGQGGLDAAYDASPSEDIGAGKDAAGGTAATGGVGGSGGAGGAVGVDVGPDEPRTQDDASDSSIVADTPDAPVGRGGSPGTGGITGSGGVPATGGSTGSGGAPGSGGVTGTGGTTSASLTKLRGTAFGTGPPYNNDPAFGFAKAFDGDINTYDDDLTASGGYVGIDLGTAASVSMIRFFPRSTKNHRMVGGKFQCSNTSQTDGYVDLHTIDAEPPLAWTEVTLSPGATACRYLRYVGPSYGYTNIAELEFWGPGSGGPGPADAGAPLTNLSFNKPVMASSQNLNVNDAVMGNDGLLTTKFCPEDAAATFPVWWLVDLGAVYQLVQSAINFEKATPYYKYRIDVSSNGTSWTTAVNQTSNTTHNGGTVTDALNVQARYVRITITGVSTTTDAGCFLELLVWGYGTPVGGGTTLTNLSLGKPVSASSQSSGKAASKGNDGVLATPFCPGNTNFPVWWRVDLGSVRSVARTDVSFEQQTSYYKYKIEVSQNGTTWTTVADQSNNTTRRGAMLSDTFTASARYVRITINAVSTPDQGCFWEFVVWGT